MTIDEYLTQCRSDLKELEEQERYEDCKDLFDLINSIEQKDVKKYIECAFDIEGCIEAGFFKKKPTWQEMEKRICQFFELKSVFEYSLIQVSAILCPINDY